MADKRGSSGPFSRSSAQSYRPGMFRLNSNLPPNPRLQRTRSAPLRSPLSRRPYGSEVKLSLAALLVGLVGTGAVQPCSRIGKVDPELDVREAEIIVVAIAAEYVREPEGDSRTTGRPDSLIGFEVAKVLKGRKVPDVLPISGYLGDRDDYNDHPAPYTFVRPGGRAGSCFANTYKKGAAFLLFLKIREDAYTVDWDALAPVNEQLHSLDDPWVAWVQGQLAKQDSKK